MRFASTQLVQILFLSESISNQGKRNWVVFFNREKKKDSASSGSRASFFLPGLFATQRVVRRCIHAALGMVRPILSIDSTTLFRFGCLVFYWFSKHFRIFRFVFYVFSFPVSKVFLFFPFLFQVYFRVQKMFGNSKKNHVFQNLLVLK